MLMAERPHDCGYYSLTGNPIWDTGIYVLIGLVILAVAGGALMFIIGSYQAGRRA